MRYTILCALAITLTVNVFSQPVISGFSPVNGPVGTNITLKGTGFDTVTAGNTIFFGAVKAIPTGSTDTSIFVNVPSGATYQSITVTTNKGTGYSQNPFVVTFGGGGSSFGPGSFLPPLEFTTGNYPHAASVADFNNDGKPDLLVPRGSSPSISLFTNTSANGVVSFSGPANITAAGNSHECSATGDLDGDGKLDFVTANTWNTNSISVFRNTTTGASITFAGGIDFPVINGTYSVAIGDLDGDGRPDIAVANNGANQLCVFRNTSTPGVISFDPRVDYAAGTSPYSVIIGDVDGDNKAELIFTTQSTGSALSVMKNKSVKDTLSFDAPIVVANFPGPFVASMGDLDGDGRPELVAAGGGIIVKQNLSTPGNIAFSGQQYTLTTGNYPVGVVIADIDGDGKPDLASCNRMSNNISLFRNLSTAGSINFETKVDYNCGQDPFFLTAGDLNSDQRPDIIVANSSSQFVSVFTNIIGANIAPTINSFNPASGISGTSVTIKGTNLTGATAVSFGSVNATSFIVVNDTTITAIVGPGASGDVNVTTSRGTASLPGFSFTGPVISSFTPKTGGAGTVVTINGVNFINVSAVSFGGVAAASYTVNSPNVITAVVGAGASGAVAVTTPNGIASLSGFSYSPPTITNVNPLYAAVDSIVTITGTNFSSTPANNIVFFGAVRSVVTAATPTQLMVKVPAGAAYKLITVTVNRLTAYSPMPFNTTFVTDSTRITTNSFSKAGDFGTGQYPVFVGYCDFNDDGKPEMITGNSLGNSVSILKNVSTPGTISFLNKTDLPAGLGSRSCITGDLDGDGKPDLIVMNFNAGQASTIAVFRNTSSGGSVSFAPKTEFATGNGSLGLAIGDLNGDGKPDLVTTSGNSGWFSIFLNTTEAGGTVSFLPRIDIVNLRHSESALIADIDKDGRPDIVVSDFLNDGLSIYRNLNSGGNFTLASPVNIPVFTGPIYMETIDADVDGTLDILVKSSAGISVIKNSSTPGSISMQSVLTLGGEFTNPSVSDLNGDGKPDFCMGGYTTGKILVYENNNTLTGTSAFGDSVVFKVGNFDSFSGIGDVDGDGKPELSATNTLSNTVTVLTNKIGAPIIDSTSLAVAKAGDTVHISGTNINGVTAVNFGGTPAASFKQISSTKVDAVVGGGASGNITVTTPLGTASFGGFSFIPVIAASGPTTLCGDGTLTLTSSANTGNQWYRNNSLVAGATAKNYNPSSSGNYTVKTTSNSITTTSSNSIDVTINTVATPGITLNGNSLMSSAVTGNQWYLNNTTIQGATGQSYQPVQSGNYTVQVTVNGCNSAMSTAFNFIVAGLIDLNNGQFVKLYPNPIHDKFVISYVLDGSTSVRLELYDINGKGVRFENNVRSGTEIDLRHLSPGVYFIKLTAKHITLGAIKIMRVE